MKGSCGWIYGIMVLKRTNFTYSASCRLFWKWCCGSGELMATLIDKIVFEYVARTYSKSYVARTCITTNFGLLVSIIERKGVNC